MKTKNTFKKMVCCHCHQDLKNHSFVIINGDYVCLECLKQNYYFCNNCNTWHLKTSDKIKVGNQYFCDNCFKLGIIAKCEKCGCYHLVSTSKKVFKKYYCSKCFKYDGTIKSYHFSKSKEPIFNGNGALYFGLELETYNLNHLNYDEHNFVAGQIIDTIGAEHLYIENDSTLHGCGFEIITQPHTMDAFNKIDFKRVCDILTTYQYCEKNENPGLHLHFSKNYLNEKQILLLTYFYSKYYNKFKKLSGRLTDFSVNRWAQVNIDANAVETIENLQDDAVYNAIKHFVYFQSRYKAVNLTNENTIEFRLGAGTTNYNQIKLWIDLHYTIYKNAKTIDLKNVSDLNAWFSGRNDLLETFKGA